MHNATTSLCGDSMVVTRANADLGRGCGYGPCVGELGCKLRSKAHTAPPTTTLHQVRFLFQIIQEQKSSQLRSSVAYISSAIAFLKPPPLLWLLRCPHLYFHLSCRYQASYTATPPSAPSRLASSTKRTAPLTLLSFFTHCYLRSVKPNPHIL